MLELNTISKVFNAGRPNQFAALSEITLTIDSLQATAFKGASGSGKTTLLTLLGCMARPTSGRITVMGREITSLPERFLTAIRQETFGFIFQHANLIKGLSALDNVMLPAFPRGVRRSLLRRRALELLDRVSLADKAEVQVEWLSGGEVQRTAIARALINDPAVLIADEPTAHLDSALSREFMALMRGFKEEGKTLIIASHDPIAYASEVIDRVVEMRDGRIVASGQP